MSRVYYAPETDANGVPSRLIADYDDLAARLAAVPGVTHAAPLIRGQVMAVGERARLGRRGDRHPARRPRGGAAGRASGDGGGRSRPARRGRRDRHRGGARARGRRRRRRHADLARGHGHARSAPSRGSATTRSSTSSGSGASTSTAPASTCPSPRRRASSTARAAADEIEVMVERPGPGRGAGAGAGRRRPGRAALLWTWRDASGAFLSALDVERRVMFIILSLVVLIAGAQHHLRPRDAGEEQGPRHRHPAHHGADPRLGDADLLPLRLADRGGRAPSSA